MTDYDFDTLKNNFTKYCEYLKKFHDDNDNIEALLNDFNEELLLAPASHRDSLHLSEPGGLIKHSMNVLSSFMNMFKSSVSESELGPMVTVSLLHDIGKVGTVDEPYYLPKFTQWSNYEINTKLKGLTIPQRSLKLLADYNIHLTDNEYSAINNSYFFIIHSTSYESVFSLPTLAKQLTIAKLMAIDKEKQSAT